MGSTFHQIPKDTRESQEKVKSHFFGTGHLGKADSFHLFGSWLT